MQTRAAQKIPLFLGFIASGMVSGSLSAVLPSARADLALSYLQSSHILTGNFLGMLLGVLVAGFLADRHGKRPFMLAGGAFMAGGLLLAALAPAYGLLLAGLALCGFGFGFWSTAINALCADMTEPGSSGGAMGFLHFFFGLGAVFGPILVKLCVLAGAWQVSFAFIAILPAAVLAFIVSLGVRWPLHHPDAAPRPAPIGKRSWAFLGLVGLTLVCYVATELSSYGWLPSWWEAEAAGRSAPPFNLLSPELAASLFWACLTLGRLVLGPLSNRMGPGPFALVSGLCALVAALLWALSPGPWASLAFAALLAFSISSVYPTFMGWANASFPGRTGLVSSLLSTFASLAGLFSPAIVGGAADRWSIGILPWILAATCAAMLLSATASIAAHGRSKA